ncbi:alpha/beta fold hydrolase [Salipiger abyssi]|uniref:Homoserine O-acetyltransferase n=1 Tax=Salipiger abyssi TaxID=1250539 RepID=A0A1P8UQ14_9RHOB|nr:alpha/beta fold hydrolase [Salipiger abyssi]APZ51461.1 homoserine O-acetyltransferase [Salipiger abyssi]
MSAELTPYKVFEAGNVALQCGITLVGAKLAYATYGRLNAAKDNVIVYPTRYGGSHADNEFLLKPGMALDPEKYFIFVPNMLGNGISSSPSNTPIPLAGPDFPAITQYDNVLLQERLLREVFGIEQIRLAAGWSMGGQQAFHWAALFPDRVAAMACFCGQAITAGHTYVFLEGVRHALITDPAWMQGRYSEQPWRGMTAKGRVWAGWVLSQDWFRQELWRDMGYVSVEDYLKNVWDAMYYGLDANDMLSMIRTWQACDISANPLYNGDRKAALAAITARSIVMPCRTDFYFPPEDNAAEVAQMPNAELRVIDSVWGHYAGGGRNAPDTAFIDAALKELLA